VSDAYNAIGMYQQFCGTISENGIYVGSHHVTDSGEFRRKCRVDMSDLAFHALYWIKKDFLHDANDDNKHDCGSIKTLVTSRSKSATSQTVRQTVRRDVALNVNRIV